MARPVQQIINVVSNNVGLFTTNDIAYALKIKGHSTTYTQGGLTDHARSKNEDLWRCGTICIMVATKFFRMGIDKPDVSFVIQESLPESPEDYLKQIGKGGRDRSLKATCHLKFSPSDRSFHLQNIVKNSKEETEKQENWKDCIR